MPGMRGALPRGASVLAALALDDRASGEPQAAEEREVTREERADFALLLGMAEGMAASNPNTSENVKLMLANLRERFFVAEKEESKPIRGEIELVDWDLGKVHLKVWYDYGKEQLEAVYLAGVVDIYEVLTDEQVAAIRRFVDLPTT